MRNAGHRDAFPSAGLFARQGDLQRASDNLGIFAVGFVKVADARQQHGFGMLGLHPEILLEHRRVFVHVPNALEIVRT